MDAHIDHAIHRLRVTKRWTCWLWIDAAAVAVAAAIVALFLPNLAFGLAVGAAGLAVAALLVRANRRELIAQLALRRDAYFIPEVAQYGAHVAGPDQRAALSHWLREAVENCGEHVTWYAEERVLALREEIVTLASEFGAPNALVTPQSAVQCKRLLTRMVESPLYNYKLPPENLRAALYRIRAGISLEPGACTAQRSSQAT
jgi:hypothetical protein